MSELLGILEKTAVPTELAAASKQLQDWASSNLPLFLKELSKGGLITNIGYISWKILGNPRKFWEILRNPSKS